MKKKINLSEDDDKENKILWFIPLILFLAILRINQNQSIFDIISKYWFDFILLSACFSLFLAYMEKTNRIIINLN